MKDGATIAPPPVPELQRVAEKSRPGKRGKTRKANLRQSSAQTKTRTVKISPVNKTG